MCSAIDNMLKILKTSLSKARINDYFFPLNPYTRRCICKSVNFYIRRRA